MSDKPHKRRLVLLDANAILHRGYHALPDFETDDGKPTGALYGLGLMLLSIVSELEPDELIACFDLPAPTHRHEMFEDYKAHRPETDKELVEQIKQAREMLDAFSIPYYEAEGFEADDLLGTIAEKAKGEPNIQTVIASGDHDTLQLVDDEKTLVYTQRRGLKDTVLYDEEAVEEKYGFGPEYLPDFKGLVGDSSDNIPGIKGVGEKTATRVIKNFGHLEEAYKELTDDGVEFADAGISTRFTNLIREGKDEAMFSKELATIRLDAEIDFSLPDTPWRERLHQEKLERFLDELEFGSLKRRAKDEFFDQDSKNKEGPEESSTKSLTDKELEEAKLALWLCDSSKTDPTEEDIRIYTDTENLETARKKLFSEMKEKEVYRVFKKIEQPLIPIIKKMEEAGIRLDGDYLADLSREYHAKLDKLEKKVHEEAEVEFNINSPKQLAEVMFEKMEIPASNLAKTSTGAISTRESELKKLEGEHHIASLVLDYRETQKLVSTYIDVLKERISDDERLHAEFVQSGTTTGRMSSKNPNLQNIPVRTKEGRKIRGAFIPADGYTLLSLDYSQIELRIAAWLSGDEKLTTVFREGRDIHSAVASDVFGAEEGKISKDQRAKAKVINYGILYGMGVNALRRNLGDDITKEEAQDYLDRYFETYSGLADFMEEKKQEVRERGFTTTFFGRRRYFPEIYSDRKYIQARAERMAINAPIQGTQADIIKRAMVDIDEFFVNYEKNLDVNLLLQVHDELVYEVPENKVKDHAVQIEDLMESVISSETANGIKMIVDTRAGPRWNELTEIN